MMDRQNSRILIIDDNRDFLQAMEAVLHGFAGYEVYGLADPTKTVEVVRSENPDVIVLDIYMPEMNGPQICRLLKAAPEFRHIPILFLTAVGTDAHFRARCLEEGADDFLEKPVGSEELIARIRVLLRIKKLQDELRRERDELERKVRERARELKQKETLAAIGKMVAGVAHEIRNPLGAISNSAAVLSRDLVLEGEDRKLMEIIVKEANRLRATITEFLTFAHPSPCRFTTVELRPLIEEVLILAKRDQLCTPDIRFLTTIPENLPAIEADRDRLKQVFWNLIRNSLEALKGAGQIEIQAETETLELQAGIMIGLCDDGPGIPDADRELVFEPFFTRKARGSGLGLPLAQSIVQAHNGRMRLVCHDGQIGCRFQIWLPLKQNRSDEETGC